jgi:hypothetical protein
VQKLYVTLGRLLIALIVGCVPVTTATVLVGAGRSEGEMAEAEHVVESMGFRRVPFESNSGGPAPRQLRENSWFSSFESYPTPGYGASVSLDVPSGLLKVVFAERDTQFSGAGEELLQKVLAELRRRLGSQVALVPSAR